MRTFFFCLLSTFLVTGCVGTDSVNDEIVSLTISIEETSLVNNMTAAIIGSEHSLSVSATNDRGTSYEPAVTWNSSSTIVATISAAGNLQALAPGTTSITATSGSVQSKPIVVTVVENSNQVALIEVTGPTSSLDIGETIPLSARALTINGEQVPGVSINWKSNNETIATIDAEGNVTGQSGGQTTIIAQTEDISGSYEISVGQTSQRSGMFEGVSGYDVEGTVLLKQNDDNSLTLEAQEDFQSSSGPGLYFYLTNNGTSIEGGVEIGELKSFSGAESYSVPGDISIEQYDQILIYCKPFGVPFGVAELNSGS